MGMAGLAVMALAGNLGFDSRETLGTGRHHPVSPDACGCRQCWREIRLGCHLGHGWSGVANRGRIHPAWTDLSQAERQVKGRITVSLQLPARSLISSGDFYCIGSDS